MLRVWRVTPQSSGGASGVAWTRGKLPAQLVSLGFIELDDNDKEIQLKLTRQGEQIYANHQRVNEEAINHLWRELKKHPEVKIEFLTQMFRWFEQYLDQSREKMRAYR